MLWQKLQRSWILQKRKLWIYYPIIIRKPKVEQLKKIADGLEISVIEFLDIEIENEADLIAMLKKISPFFKWDGLLHVLEGEKFL